MTTKAMTPANTPVRFFFRYAGYSWNPLKGETQLSGRWRCARALAKAEREATERGFSFEWMEDETCDSSEFSKKRPAWTLWACIARDESGTVIGSLSAIDFGRDRSPWGEPYRRVVEAELAHEHIG